MKELYELYGKLMIDAEILNSRIAEVKQKIAQELNRPRVPDDSEGKDKGGIC